MSWLQRIFIRFLFRKYRVVNMFPCPNKCLIPSKARKKVIIDIYFHVVRFSLSMYFRNFRVIFCENGRGNFLRHCLPVGTQAGRKYTMACYIFLLSLQRIINFFCHKPVPVRRRGDSALRTDPQ